MDGVRVEVEEKVAVDVAVAEVVCVGVGLGVGVFNSNRTVTDRSVSIVREQPAVPSHNVPPPDQEMKTESAAGEAIKLTPEPAA
jgi:hypothetical protein